MRKTMIATILCVGSLPALAQQAPPSEVTDLQLQAARADSAEKAAAFNKLAYERVLADARKMQTEMTSAAADKDEWWGKCVHDPICVEWINSGPAKMSRPKKN